MRVLARLNKLEAKSNPEGLCTCRNNVDLIDETADAPGYDGQPASPRLCENCGRPRLMFVLVDEAQPERA